MQENDMELVNGVFELSEKFMQGSEYVKLNDNFIRMTADVMLETGITPFPPESSGEDLYIICWKELIASSINYCYWYGKSSIRPNESSSTTMYGAVNTAFDMTEEELKRNEDEFNYPHNLDIEDEIEIDPMFYFSKGGRSWTYLQYGLAGNRFPLLEERLAHLKEVEQLGGTYVRALLKSEGKDFYPLLYDLVLLFPGFASDMFLKRASLFFMQLYRRLGWFEDAMQVLPVPADYQVPNMLRQYGCIEYDAALRRIIDTNQLIHKHSEIECEIRAATVLAGKKLQELTGWNASEIDAWLWLRRKEATTPFHLTITTDY